MKILVLAVLVLAAMLVSPSAANRRRKPKCRKTYTLSDGDSVNIAASNTNGMKKCIYRFRGNEDLFFALKCNKFNFKQSRGCRREYMRIKGLSGKYCGKQTPDGGTDEPVSGVTVVAKGNKYSFSCQMSAHADNGGVTDGATTKSTTRAPATTGGSTAPPSGECCAKYTPGLTRIVGGTNSKKGEFPWQAALLGRDGQQDCGGTLVSAYWVVTAKHCVPKARPNRVTVTLGDYDVTQPDGETKYAVEKIVKPPKTYGFDDIALLKLKTKVTFSDKIRPACLPFSYTSDKFDGKSVWITGWGQTSTNQNSVSTILKKVFVPVVTNKVCKKTYGDDIQSNMLCAGSPRKGGCFGDSGGPAIWVHPSTSHAFLVGVVSFGDESCSTTKFTPGVFTRVTTYLTWIKNTIQGDGICNV